MQEEARGETNGDVRPAKRSRLLRPDGVPHQTGAPATKRAGPRVMTEIPTARWTRLHADGTVEWDASKVRCFYSDEERKDELMLRNVVHGAIVSGRMYPLIFDGDAATSPIEWARLRSMPFYESMVADRVVYDALSEEAKRIVAVGLRDLFFAASAGLLSEHETAIFKRMIHIVERSVDDLNAEEEEPCRLVVEAQGMQLSFHPSARFSVVRFIEHLDEATMDAEWVGYFARAGDVKGTHEADDGHDGGVGDSEAVPVLHAVFVDPAELSYHNFENIVPLDRWFEAKSRATAAPGSADGKGEGAAAMATADEQSRLDLKLSSVVKHQPSDQRDCRVLSARLSGRSVELLRELDGLDLYVQPLNAETRGGKRFIFQSALLSKALSAAVRASGLLSALEPAPCVQKEGDDEDDEGEREEKKTPRTKSMWELLAGGKRRGKKTRVEKKEEDKRPTLASSFAFVNSVFRLNRFGPGDAKFASHRDTPYYDASRHHVSKYTMLLYLTGGRGDPWALRVDDLVRMEHIEEMTCVIFDQSLEHEGRPYVGDGVDKVFLRTELIFEDHRLEHDPSVAALFSKACYMTGQGVLQPELNAWAHAYYERVNALHWRLDQPTTGSPPDDALLLYKRASGSSHRFMTNGYDYWFLHHPDERSDRSAQLKEFAVLAVLDYFNGKLQRDHAFRELLETVALCKPGEIKTPADIDEWVWAYMQGKASEENAELGKAGKEKKEKKVVPHIVSYDRETVKSMISDIVQPPQGLIRNSRHCCPFHCYFSKFTASKCEDIISCYMQCRKYTASKLLNAPVWLLNTEVIINESNILIDSDKIYITQAPGMKGIPPINFAACWNNPESPPDYIEVEGSHCAPKLLIPPIIYRAYPQGYRLILDFFRNDWMVRVDMDRTVPVPAISEGAEEGQSPYLRAINPKLLKKSFFNRGWRIHGPDSDGEEADQENEFPEEEIPECSGRRDSSDEDEDEENEEEEEDDDDDWSPW